MSLSPVSSAGPLSPVNGTIHVPHWDRSTAGNELHTYRPLEPYSTVPPHKYGPQCFDCVTTISYQMHIRQKLCEMSFRAIHNRAFFNVISGQTYSWQYRSGEMF